MRPSNRTYTCIIASVILIAGGFNCVSNSPIPCETDADCGDGLACTVDACVDLFCRNTAVACPQGQVCVPTTGVCEVGECAANSHCDDRVFCNGVEVCDIASLTCGPGAAPCSEDQVCEEIRRRCRDIECVVDADCDDGDSCTTDVCDDLLCSNTELECPSGQLCFQFTGDCRVSECAKDADCDDGVFCNGQEFCSLLARSCQPAATVPCTDGSVRCNEEQQTCEGFRCVTDADCSPGQRCSISGGCLSQ